MSYVKLSVDPGDDPDTLYAGIVTQLQSAFPGWQPYPGHLETVIAQASAGEWADERTLIADMGSEAFAQWGRTTLGIAQIAAVAATISVTFTAVSALVDRTIPAGTVVGPADTTGDDDLTFTLAADLLLEAGLTTASAILAATVAGSAPNQVLAGPLQLLSNISWLTGVTATAPVSGGVDAETDDAYLSRVQAEAQTTSTNAVHPIDFAILALSVPGVARAIAVDGWDGNTGHGLSRCVAVVPLQADGTPCGSVVRAAVVALLQTKREAGFIVAASVPIYYQVVVATTVDAVAGADHPTVATGVIAAVSAFLEPAGWAGGGTVRLFDLVPIIGGVDGVDHITALTINGTAADFAMPGDVPLPAGMAVSAVADSWLTSVSSVMVTVT